MTCSVRDVIEEFLRLLRAEVVPNTVLTTLEDSFEVKQTPCLVVMGPKPVLNKAKITVEPRIAKDLNQFTYEKRNPPAFYYLDFDLTLISDSGPELIDLQAALLVFFLDHKEIFVGPVDSFYLEESVPIGDLKRVNLSNLRQASGKCRIVDVEIQDHFLEAGKLVRFREFVLKDKNGGGVLETISPDGG